MTRKPAQAKPRARGKRSPDLDREETSYRPFAEIRARAKRSQTNVPTKEIPKLPPATPTRPEELSFAQHMSGVRRLSGRGTAVVETARTPVLPKALVETRFEVMDDGITLEGRRLDVDPREVGRLRRAQIPIDGTLDLHGKTLLDAKSAVLEYVARRRRQGDRAILIVHGKGLHSSRGHAVLRGELGAWLSQGAAAKHVHAFASRLDPDERSGALAVLLANR